MTGCNQDCAQGHCACAPNYETQWGDRILRRLIQFDIWLMRTFLGGKPHETISAAAWNAHLTGKFFGFTYIFIDLLFRPWMTEHCRKAWVWQRRLYETA